MAHRTETSARSCSRSQGRSRRKMARPATASTAATPPSSKQSVTRLASAGTRRPRARYALRAAATLLVLFAAMPAARAQKSGSKSAGRAYYDRGTTEYNLGHFDEAIKSFESAYELEHQPILLFNIAQAHRQMGNNERAIFFYRRYLENAPKDAQNR